MQVKPQGWSLVLKIRHIESEQLALLNNVFYSLGNLSNKFYEPVYPQKHLIL